MAVFYKQFKDILKNSEIKIFMNKYTIYFKIKFFRNSEMPGIPEHILTSTLK